MCTGEAGTPEPGKKLDENQGPPASAQDKPAAEAPAEQPAPPAEPPAAAPATP